MAARGGALTPEELAFVLRDCGAAAVFTGAEHAAGVAELTSDLPELRSVIAFGGAATDGVVAFDDLLGGTGPVPEVDTDPLAPSTIGYTSGTTGTPRVRCRATRPCCSTAP